MGKSFYVLVDYDNLEKNASVTQELCCDALRAVIRNLDQKSDFFTYAEHLQRVNIILYGGWFFWDSTAFKAQDVIRETADTFPELYTLRNRKKVNLFCEMSYGILSLGKYRNFYATFRDTSASFFINRNYKKCCEDGDICVDFVREWLQSHKCTYCSKINDKLFVSYGQKMVDSMIMCDLATLSKDPDNIIAVVSSDDDLIPILFQTTLSSNNIYHQLTLDKPGWYFVQYYERIKPRSYKNIPFTW